MAGNFDSFIGVPNLWKDSVEREAAHLKASVLLGIFCFLSLMLFISIVQTIRTSPGGIPEDKEWDMQSDSMNESSSDGEGLQFDAKNKKQNE